MTDNRRLDRIEAKLDEVIDSVAALREEVAGYRATIRFLKWLVTLMPAAGGLLYAVFKKTV